MRYRLAGGLALASALLCGCSEQIVEQPAPMELTGDEIGYFCNMTVVNHNGPKGQIFVAGEQAPLWFTSVRDTLTFTRLPDEPRQILAIYVNDAGRAAWDQPEAGTWIDATQAVYVVGSSKRGGMGAPELVPFSSRDTAMRFADKHGGKLVDYPDITQEMLFDSS